MLVMKICFLGTCFDKLGGVEITTRDLVKELKNKLNMSGIDIDAYSLSISNENADKWFHTTPKKYANKYLHIIHSIYYLSRVKNYDVIISSYFIVNVFNSILSRLFNHKSIIQEHSSYHYDGLVKKMIKILFYRLSNTFIVLNEYDKAKWARFGLQPYVIHNIVRNFHSNSPHKNKKSNYFLVASRLDKNKRIHLIISAYKKYLEMNGNRKLIICGNGPEYENLRSLSHGYQGIEFHGAVSNIQNYYHDCFALLVASKLECLPTSIIEAMKCGKPTIALNVPSGIPEIIQDDVNGYLVDRIDNYPIKMRELESNYQKFNIGCEKTAKQFDNNKIVNQYISILTTTKNI